MTCIHDPRSGAPAKSVVLPIVKAYRQRDHLSMSNTIQASWQDMARIPQMLGEVRTGILALQALLSTPAAAAASGSPVAGAAIVGLGAELALFIAQTVQAIDDDIDGIRTSLQNYQRNEDELVQMTQTGLQSLDQRSGANGAWCPAPQLNSAPLSSGAAPRTAAAQLIEVQR
jgi:hypothetical protein